MSLENWIFPLTILPGIGLIIMSTTNWSVALTNEINRLLENMACDQSILKRKVKQLGLINNALVALYCSAAMCTLGGFIGSLWTYSDIISSALLVTLVVAVGIAALLAATTMLIIYAYRAVNIKRTQFEERLKNL